MRHQVTAEAFSTIRSRCRARTTFLVADGTLTASGSDANGFATITDAHAT